MRLWWWRRRRRSEDAACQPADRAVEESAEEVLKDVRHNRELREHHERLRQLSDELSLIRRDEERS